VSTLLSSFELNVRYKATTSERTAVLNTRGEGNILGYTVLEPTLGPTTLVISKSQKVLLAMMATFGPAIANNGFLMSQWLRMFMHDTMRVNGLTYDLCDFEFTITTEIKKAEAKKLVNLP